MVELSTVDALKWVRSQPTRFFNRPQPEPVALLAYIMADVVQLGRGECVIRSVADWYVIGSNASWLTHERYEAAELFRHIVPASEHGQHSMRGEVLVSAFAQDVAVIGPGGVLTVQGETPPKVVVDATSGMKQAIAFRL